MSVLRSIGTATVLVGLLAGCSEEAVVPAQPAQPRATAPAPQAAIVASEAEEFRYEPAGKPDPFKSFVRLAASDDTLTTPLERFDLSQLTLAAIVWGTEEPRALIKDPAGSGYIVSAGTPIGKNQGRITAIEDNVVRVKETYVDFRDQATTKEVEMRLHDSEGG